LRRTPQRPDASTPAFRAGVPDIVISRQYSEMTLDNLRGVNDALRQAGIIN
jgi:hypothetical protein